MSDLLLLPMHGEPKMIVEGFRTRDTHLIEWFQRLRPDLAGTVVSRPEPWPRASLARRRGSLDGFPGWDFETRQLLVSPLSLDPSRWWVRSAELMEIDRQHRATVIWNPLGGAHLLRTRRELMGTVVVDLLDDWSVHYAFERIADEVEDAYAALFAEADAVVANSEGTVALAARFGREARLLLNGCDAERFSTRRRLGEPPTVGYLGKLGSRMDIEMVEAVCTALPEVQFEFAGPIVERTRAGRRAVRARFDALPNTHMLGDVPYPDVPSLLETWDLAWIPHRVGRGEVGGDVIKQYEYRAAGLPVLSTPIIGHDRWLPGVIRTDRPEDAVAAISECLRRHDERGTLRIPAVIPDEVSWRDKARTILQIAGLSPDRDAGGTGAAATPARPAVPR